MPKGSESYGADLVVRLTPFCAVEQAYPEIAPLAGAILAPLVIAALEKSIDAAGVALVAAGQDKTETFSAATSYSYKAYAVASGAVSIW